MPDRYGDPLPKGALARMGTIGVASGGRIQDLALSVDGSLLAVAAGGEVRVLDASTGRLLHELHGHFAEVAAVLFEPARRKPLLFSASADGTLRIWKGDKQKAKIEIGEQREKARALRVFGDHLVLAAYQSLYVYDFKGRLRQTVDGFGSWTNDLTLHPDGTEALVCCDQGLWRVTLSHPWGHKKSTATLTQIDSESWASAAAYRPEGRVVLVQGEKSIEVRDANTWERLGELPGEAKRAECIAVSRDGGLIAAGTGEQTFVWRTQDNELLAELDGGRGVFAVCFTADGRQLLTGGFDGLLRRWSTETFAQLDLRPRHNSYIAAVAFTSEGRRVVSCGEDRDVRAWASDTGEHLGFKQGRTFSVACSPTEPICIVGHRDYHAGLYAISSDGPVHARDLDGEGPTAWFRAFAFSADGRLVAAASDGAVLLWDVTTGALRWKMGTNGTRMWSVAFSPSGDRVAAGGEDHHVRVWDTREGHRSGGLELLGDVQFVGFIDEQHLLVSSSTIRLWRLGEESEVRRYQTTGRVLALAHHRKAFVCGGDALEVIACADGRVLQRFDPRDSTSAAFSTDDQRLVTGHHDRTALVWQLDLPELTTEVKTTAPPAPRFELVLTAHAPTAMPFWEVAMSGMTNPCTPEQDFPDHSGVWINLPNRVSLRQEGQSSMRSGTPPRPVIPLCGFLWNEGADQVTRGLYIVARDLATGNRTSGYLQTSVSFGHDMPPPPIDPDDSPSVPLGGSGGPFNVSMGFLVPLPEKPATYEIHLEHENGDRSNTVTVEIVA